jgi:hypothetical protein
MTLQTPINEAARLRPGRRAAEPQPEEHQNEATKHYHAGAAPHTAPRSRPATSATRATSASGARGARNT